MPPVTRAVAKSLAFAQITANQTGFSSAADVTGLSITITAGNKPIWVEAQIVTVVQQTSSGIPVIFITNDSNQEVTRWTAPSMGAGVLSSTVLLRRRLTNLTPGTSYTFKVRASTSAGTVDVRANTDAIPTVNGPAWIRAYEEQ